MVDGDAKILQRTQIRGITTELDSDCGKVNQSTCGNLIKIQTLNCANVN